MSKKIIQHNAITGETIEREPTTEETLYFAELADELAQQKINDTNKAKARQAVLDKLGLTADEAAALLGQFGNTGDLDRLRNNTRKQPKTNCTRTNL